MPCSRHILCALAVTLLLPACTFSDKSLRSGVYRFLAPGTLAVARKQYAEAYFDIPTTERWVALTIDDTPNAVATQGILDLLARSPGNPHATFFVVGEYAAQHPALLAAITRGGHELGNHTYENTPTADLALTEFIQSVERTYALLREHLDPQAPKWFRPGYARYTEQQARYLIEQRGYQIALGNAYPYDFGDDNVPAAVSHIKRFVRPGAIIVLHDGPEYGQRTVAILEEILPWLAREGYQVKTLSELHASAR